MAAVTTEDNRISMAPVLSQKNAALVPTDDCGSSVVARWLAVRKAMDSIPGRPNVQVVCCWSWGCRIAVAGHTLLTTSAKAHQACHPPRVSKLVPGCGRLRSAVARENVGLFGVVVNALDSQPRTVRVQSQVASTSPRSTQPSIPPGSVNEEQPQCCDVKWLPSDSWTVKPITTYVAGYKLEWHLTF